MKTKVATAELAYDLQVAVTKQNIKEEEMAIKITERAQEIKVQQEVCIYPCEALDELLRCRLELSRFFS